MTWKDNKCQSGLLNIQHSCHLQNQLPVGEWIKKAKNTFCYKYTDVIYDTVW